MHKTLKKILYLVTVIFIFIQAGKTCTAESIYNFSNDNPYTYKGEEVFQIKENVTADDFSKDGRVSYPQVKEIIVAKGVTVFDWDSLTKGYFPNVETIKIAGTVTDIKSSGYNFYDKLVSLKDIQVAEDNPIFSTENGCFINKKKALLIQYPPARDNTFCEIPDTVTEITGNAFMNAGNLKTLTIGAKLKSDQIKNIREQLNFIKEFKVSSKNPFFQAKDGVLFNKKGDTLLFHPNGKGESYSVPKGTLTIETYAFYQSSLKTVTLPKGLKTINDNAFSTCFELTGITIPKSVTKMKGSDFTYSKALEYIQIESGSKLYSSYNGILYNTAKTKLILVPKAYKKASLKFLNTLTELNLNSFDLSETTEIQIPKALKKLDSFTDTPKCFDKITVDAGNKNFVLDKGSLYSKDKTILYLFKKQTKGEFPEGLMELNIRNLLDSGITELALPKKAKIISWTENIYDIPSLKKVTANGSMYYTLKNGMLLSKDGKILYDIPRNRSTLDIPDTVREIDSIFTLSRRNFTQISIPESFPDLNTNSFDNFTSVTSVIVDKDNKSFTSIDGVLYDKGVTLLLYYPIRKTDKSYVVPDTVEVILASSSLVNNPYLEDLTLSKTLEYRAYDLHMSRSLKEIKVSDENAFYKSLDGVLYNKDMTELLAYPHQKPDKTFTIPDSVITVSGFCGIKERNLIDDYQYTVEAVSNPYLETLKLGKNVKTLFSSYDGDPIWDFKNLQKFEVNEQNKYFSTKDGILYNKECSIMYLYPKDSRNTVLTIPGGVKKIETTCLASAANNKYLTSIVVKDDNKAFSTDGSILMNYMGNHKYFEIGDTEYNKVIYSD